MKKYASFSAELLSQFADGCFIRYTDPGGELSDVQRDIYIGVAKETVPCNEGVIVYFKWLVRIRKTETSGSSDEPEWQPIEKTAVAYYSMFFAFTSTIRSKKDEVMFQSDKIWVEMTNNKEGGLAKIVGMIEKQLDEQKVLF